MTEISVFLDIPDIEVIGIERTKNGDYYISALCFSCPRLDQKECCVLTCHR